MKVAVKYVKPVQQLNTLAMNEVKPLNVVFREVKLEVDALVALPKKHPNIVGLEGAIAKFPTEQDPNQQVKHTNSFINTSPMEPLERFLKMHHVQVSVYEFTFDAPMYSTKEP